MRKAERYPSSATGIDARTETQGKCVACEVRYIWPRKVRVRVSDAFCPQCGSKLFATTHLLYWPVERISRPLTGLENLRTKGVEHE